VGASRRREGLRPGGSRPGLLLLRLLVAARGWLGAVAAGVQLLLPLLVGCALARRGGKAAWAAAEPGQGGGLLLCWARARRQGGARLAWALRWCAGWGCGRPGLQGEEAAVKEELRLPRERSASGGGGGGCGLKPGAVAAVHVGDGDGLD